MKQTFRHSQRAAHEAVQKAQAKIRATGKGFSYDSTEEDEEINEEDLLDIEVSDSTDDEDDYATEDSPEHDGERETIFNETGSPSFSGIIPIWVFCAGKIVWSANKFGFHVRSRERMRRKLNDILDFLHKNISEQVTPLSLEGFLSKALLVAANKGEDEEPAEQQDENNYKKKESDGWIAQLDKWGIVIDGITFPLDYFILKQGGSSVTMPDILESVWLNSLIKERELKSLAWKEVKDWLPQAINDFCKDLNMVAGTEFDYKESTLQRKKLPIWKKWLESSEADNS